VTKPDTSNAQIRKESSKRKSPDAAANEAQRLLDDPAFIRGFDAVREGVLNELEAIKHDGQTETDDYERELCRTLRTLKSVRRAIALGVQGQKLRLAEFRAGEPEPE
jgi:hypothetical protein